MFGRQQDSKKSTAPAFGFGSSNRDGAAKVFLTSEHAKALYGLEGPGPVYDLKSSVGRQDSSKNETAPLFSFGTADRFSKQGATSAKQSAPGPGAYSAGSSIGKQGDSTKGNSEAFGFGSSTRAGAARVFLSPEHAKSDFGKCSPGPSVYSGKSAVGRQPDSKKENSPAWVFSSEHRFKYDHVERAAHVPGAGQYNTIGSVGPQAESKKGNIPRFSFGSSNRDQRAKVYISADHEKGSYGMASPGPASVGAKSSVGKQSNSKNPTGNAWSFGTSKRLVYQDGLKAPGPGAYD